MPQSLSASEIDSAIRTLPKWRLQNGKLVRKWEFKDFTEAMQFVRKVAELAESIDHHPDIDIRYNHVLLALISHDAQGITRRDVAMAAQLDALMQKT